MRLTKSILSFFLLSLAFLTVGLAFIPILFPLVLSLWAFLLLLGVPLLLFSRTETGIPGGGENHTTLTFLIRFFTGRGLEDYPRESPDRRTYRSLRLGSLALLLNLFLYFFLSLHSWACYISSLRQDLAPLQEQVRILSEESRRSHSSMDKPGRQDRDKDSNTKKHKEPGK